MTPPRETRPSLSTMIGVVGVAWAIIATVALVGFLFGGCGPQCIAEGGVPGADRCDRTFEALKILDHDFDAAGFYAPGDLSHVTWIPGESFMVYHEGDEDVMNLWGRDNVVPFHCEQFVSTRNQDRIARTSLAHESLHCAFTATCLLRDPTSNRCELDGDPGHSRSEWTDGFLDGLKTHLAEAGL